MQLWTAVMLIAAFPSLPRAAEHCTRTLGWNKSVEIGACQFRREKEGLVGLIHGEKSVSTDGLYGRRAIESNTNREEVSMTCGLVHQGPERPAKE